MKKINYLLFAVLLLLAACKKKDETPKSVTDVDGNTYQTVKIGDQVWMAENLKTAKYNDGSSIANVTDANQWSGATSGAYCYYNNAASNNGVYGKLYNWYAVNTGKLCPKGWHIPTKDEFATLSSTLGGDNYAGGKLKATNAWTFPNTGASNESGFSALPGGNRKEDGSFAFIDDYGYLWSSTPDVSGWAFLRPLHYNDATFNKGAIIPKSTGLSCRCLLDN
jgi:uncharacterized protein (TIGR02145 family)